MEVWMPMRREVGGEGCIDDGHFRGSLSSRESAGINQDSKIAIKIRIDLHSELRLVSL
jgi:hypothetical protein